MNDRISLYRETGSDAGDQYETITLLSEEVQRLEAELAHWREEAVNREAAREWDSAPSQASAEETERLRSDLAERDEMVVYLLDQVRLLEEADAARAAESEHLSHWLEEVERRVDRQGPADEERERLLRKIDSDRIEFESARQAWSFQRRGLEEESERLRSKLAEPALQSGSGAGSVKALEREIEELRSKLARSAEFEGEVQAIREELAQTRPALEASRCEAERLRDDLERTRLEHEAELAALKTQAAVEAAQAGAEPRQAEGHGVEVLASKMIAVDERIRAFRQHLHDLHACEVEAKKSKSLGNRLSRLWGRSAPGPAATRT